MNFIRLCKCMIQSGLVMFIFYFLSIGLSLSSGKSVDHYVLMFTFSLACWIIVTMQFRGNDDND